VELTSEDLPFIQIKLNQSILKNGHIIISLSTNRISLPRSDGRAATMTSGLDYHHGVSYYSSIVSMAIKCTVFSSRGTAWDRRADGQTDRSVA